MSEMTNVLQFNGSESSKCRVGSYAHHAEHGCVTVVAASGLMRTIEITDYRALSQAELVVDLPDGIAPSEVLYGTELDQTYAEVSVTSLRDLDRERKLSRASV
ncbi:MAG: hypothetical protein EAZ30_02695 [Betaproteobacteria bacterium]|nr:MAG: hypothetical protein EAZ30_02695 [Betaproteobacteria bacterium]